MSETIIAKSQCPFELPHVGENVGKGADKRMGRGKEDEKNYPYGNRPL
jgi:hypothetical protein